MSHSELETSEATLENRGIQKQEQLDAATEALIAAVITFFTVAGLTAPHAGIELWQGHVKEAIYGNLSLAAFFTLLLRYVHSVRVADMQYTENSTIITEKSSQ